jgi:hypothetical protein
MLLYFPLDFVGEMAAHFGEIYGQRFTITFSTPLPHPADTPGVGQICTAELRAMLLLLLLLLLPTPQVRRWS